MRCRLPGPQEPAQAARVPVIWASAPHGECGGLLVSDLDPLDGRVAANGVDDRVEAVADDAVQALDARPDENVDELLRHVLLGHGCVSSPS